MSYGQQYGQYGGNPYGGSEGNPYGQTGGDVSGGYGSSAPHGGGQLAPPLSHEASNYSQGSNYSGQATGAPDASAPHQSSILSVGDYLTRVENVKASIRRLAGNVGQIGTLHQRVLSATDNSSSTALESLVSDTQILNTEIKDQIKFLETDAARSGGNSTKDTQIRSLKQSFKSQLEDFRREEQDYKHRYQDQIARQYRIVNPDATEEEVQEAAQADWGDEGVFQTALRTNRVGHATSVLGAVRARHNDIQKIEATLIELNQLFQDLAEAVVVQEPLVAQVEEQTHKVKDDTVAANTQLDKGIEHIRRARKLKFWCLGITILIICILALVLGLVFGVAKK